MTDEHNWPKRPTYKQGKIIKDYTDWDFRMWPLAIVTGWLH